MKELGRFEKVELREQWSDEARDFTPWLARPENLAILSDTLGIDLELEALEENVGPFHADLLCRDTSDTDRWVVIENQLEKTNHRHLGQLLTYAAGLKASTVVWVSSDFCDEHKAALDWLNQVVGKSVRFFGLVIELWRIGESPAAPRFNVVCQPNEWEATVRNAAASISDEDDKPRHKLRLRYWTAFRSYLLQNNSKLRTQKPGRGHWYSFGIGTTLAHTAALLIARDNRIAVELAITRSNAKEIFASLLQCRDAIEQVIGTNAEWREIPERKASKISVFKTVDPHDEAAWPEQFAWLQQNLENFDRAFRPLLARNRDF